MRKRGILSLGLGVAALVASLSACYDMLDVLGQETSDLEKRGSEDQEIRDDDIADKHPDYDPDRTVVEEFDGCQVTLNKSASVTKLDIVTTSADSPLYPTRLEAVADASAMLDASTSLVPSLETVNGYFKAIDDGVYAAIEVAVEEGQAGIASKLQFLRDFASALRAAYDAEPEPRRGHLGAALAHVAAGLLVAGQDIDFLALPPDVSSWAREQAQEFDADPVRSVPIGFYTWTETLETVFRQDRFLQNQGARAEPDALTDAEFGRFAAMAAVLGANPDLKARYEQYVGLYAGLTNRYGSYPVSALFGLVGDMAALDDVPALKAQFLADHDPPFVCSGAYFAVFPASRSKDSDYLAATYCQVAPPAGTNLLDVIVQAIRNGDLDLTPEEDAGWYEYQVYALETLLVPEKGIERDHLFLTAAYKKKLIDSFKSMLVQIRETHVKQLSFPALGASTATKAVRVYPKLPAEPFPTFYLRTARAYRFVTTFLAATLGAEPLQELHTLREGGAVSDATILADLDHATKVAYGLYALTARALGMDPEAHLLADEEEEFPLEVCEVAATDWLAHWEADPLVVGDSRVAVPGFYDALTDEVAWWAVVGVKWVVANAAFYEGYEPEVVSVGGGCEFDGFVDHDYVLFVDTTVQVLRPASAQPLTRDVLRQVCDAHQDVDSIRRALEELP